MNRLLKALRARHEIVEARVQEEQRKPKPDSLSLLSLKRIRLQLRDQIASLERVLQQGSEPARNRLSSKRRPATS